MRAVRDLIGGHQPMPIDIHYNGDIAADGTTLRYKGSLCKFMDFEGYRTNGTGYVTWGGETTASENLCGILEESSGTSGQYLPNNATYGLTTKKMTPIFSSTVIKAEYARTDPSGTATTDTTATATASTTFTPETLTTADKMNGGWIYMVTGNNAGALRYILNDSATALTFATAMNYATIASDTFLVIQPAVGMRQVDFDAHFVNIKSDTDSAANLNYIIGLRTTITAPGIGEVALARDVHDGLTIANARFFHEFIIGGNAVGIGNAYNFGLFA
jgi:hypothetical protein